MIILQCSSHKECLLAHLHGICCSNKELLLQGAQDAIISNVLLWLEAEVANSSKHIGHDHSAIGPVSGWTRR